MEQRSNRWCSAEQQWSSSGAIHSFQNAPLGPRGNRNAFSHFGTREACLTGITSFKLIPFSSECDNLWKCVQQSRSSRYYLNIQEHLMKQQNVFVIVFLSIGLLLEQQSDIGPILQCIDSLELTAESSSTISIEKRQGLEGGLCSSFSLLKNIRRDLGSLLLQQPNLVSYIFVLYHNLENTRAVITDDGLLVLLQTDRVIDALPHIVLVYPPSGREGRKRGLLSLFLLYKLRERLPRLELLDREKLCQFVLHKPEKRDDTY